MALTSPIHVVIGSDVTDSWHHRSLYHPHRWPVSYTHLDVYKRQLSYSLGQFLFLVTFFKITEISCSISNSFNVEARSSRTLHFILFPLLDPFRPVVECLVSQTHTYDCTRWRASVRLEPWRHVIQLVEWFLFSCLQGRAHRSYTALQDQEGKFMT